MERISKMWRSALAMVLAICMVLSFCPVAAFAAGTEIKYVSLGDSMTNGYGLPGYGKNSGVEDYGIGSYANQFATEIGATSHAQLAMSAMRAEDLHWLLELNYNDAAAIALTEEDPWDEAAWNAKFTTGDYWTWNEICTHSRTKATTDAIKALVDPSFYPATYKGDYDGDVALIAKYFQESVKNADVISLGMGNGNFGVFMFGRIMEAVGFSGSPSDALIYKVDRALAECPAALKAQILSMKAQLYSALEAKMGASISSNPTLEALANTVIYTALSYVLNYAGSVEAILKLNPDAEIVLVELMNTFSDGNKKVEGVTLGDLLDVTFTPLNAFIAALPTVMQASGNSAYANATFYYAEANGIQCMVDTYGDDFYLDEECTMPNPDSTIRDRFVESIVGYCDHDPCSDLAACPDWENGMVWGLLGGVELAPGMSLCRISFADVFAYVSLDDAGKAAYAANDAQKALSIAAYLAFEQAVSYAGKHGEPVTVDAIMGLGGMDTTMFNGVMTDFKANIGTAGAAKAEGAAAGVAKIVTTALNGMGFSGTVTGDQILSIYVAADKNAAAGTVADTLISGNTALIEALAKEGLAKEMYGSAWDDMDDTAKANAMEDCWSLAGATGQDAATAAAKATAKSQISDALVDAVANIDTLCMLLAMPDTLGTSLKNSSELAGLLGLFSRCVVGNGLGAHPSQNGHNKLAESVIAAYGNYTAKDETVENINYVLGELKGFLEKYGPDAADMAYEMWVKYGYEQIVNDCIAELTAMVDARYTNYIENVLPALNDAIVALNGQKDALNTELVTLKTQLDEKKAELLKVLAEQEITEITPPEFDIETELGNNEQTQVPENDCAGTGNVADELQAAIADLEHAIAVVEALIADVTADIEDMVALATEIAEGVATLEQTLTDIAAAAQDLKGAVDAVVAVLTDDSAKAASKTFMKAFNAARDAALIAVDTVEMLVETVNGDVATIEASLATLEEYANKLADNFDATKGNILGEVMDAIPEDALMIIGGSVMLVQQTLEENKEAIIAALNTQKDALLSELNTQKDAILLDLNNEKDAILKDLGEKKDALAAEYGPQIDEALLQLNAKKDEINNEIQTKYAELQANAQEQIDNLQKDAQVKLDALNLELQGYMAQLAGDISDELRAEIQPQIDRINNDIATINADLACAIEHVNAELQEAYDNLVEEVNNIYNDVMTELQNAYDTLVDAYNTAVKQLQDAADEAIKQLQDAADEAIKQLQDAYDEAVKQLQDAADKAIQDLVDAAQKELDKLGEIGDMLSGILDGVLQAIHGDISAAQQAIANVLAGIQGSVSELADALIDLGVDSVNALVDEVTKVINDMLHKATHADLELYGDSIYVALGDGTAVAEGYAEKVGEQLKAEYGVSTTINYAEAGNTVGAELTKVAGRDGIADADLITIGFGNTTILENAVRKAGRVDYDWAELVGEDLVPYVEDALAEAYAEVAKAGMDAEMTAYANAMIEGFAYGAVEYAVELPALIAAIREVNADAVIVVVGQYNPMSGVVLELDGATLDLSEYIDYFVDAVAVHGIGYAMITGDAIFVEAPEVTTSNTDMSWNMIDLAMMIANPEGFEVLNPNEAGEVYIANQILEALNISQIGLWGDADGDGIVNLRDAMLILKAANNHEVSINRKLSDVTGDGDVNLADAMWVLKRANKHSDLFPVEK